MKDREERYAALTLLDLKHRSAWWDLVDEVATHRVLPCFDESPAQAAKIVKAWSKTDNLRLRRAAIICQVLRRSAASQKFFLRKAIGWGLRAAAKTNGPQILAYVEEHRGRLSGPSIREAEKGLRS